MLSLKPKYIDEILSASQDSYEEVIQALFQLEAKGYIKQIHQNLYIKKCKQGVILYAKISSYRRITGESQNNQKVPGQELRSDRVQRACSRSAKEYLRIDIENDFEPKYITIRGKGEVLAALRKAVKKQTKYTSRLTRTVKEKPSHGIYITH